MTPDDRDLERLIHASLRALPDSQAPRTLLPRVLAATTGAAAAPWYLRTWWTWPLELQSASAIATLIVLSVVAVLASGVMPVDSVLALLGLDRPAWLVATLDAISGAAVIARTVWRVLLEPAVGASLALMVVVALTCALGRSAVSRLALGGASHS